MGCLKEYKKYQINQMQKKKYKKQLNFMILYNNILMLANQIIALILQKYAKI